MAVICKWSKFWICSLNVYTFLFTALRLLCISNVSCCIFLQLLLLILVLMRKIRDKLWKPTCEILFIVYICVLIVCLDCGESCCLHWYAAAMNVQRIKMQLNRRSARLFWSRSLRYSIMLSVFNLLLLWALLWDWYQIANPLIKSYSFSGFSWSRKRKILFGKFTVSTKSHPSGVGAARGTLSRYHTARPDSS